MQAFIVPLSNDVPFYRFKVDLSGVQFTVRARYNQRMDRWVIDIADPSNNDIINGLKICIRTELFAQYVIPGLPVGSMIAEDNRNTVQDQPVRNSFGTTHSLLYMDPTQ